MTSEIIEFISSFKMKGNGHNLVNTFNLDCSKTETTSKNEKSFLVENLNQASDLISSIHESLNNEKIKDDLKVKIKRNLISELEPFYLVVSVPNGIKTP